jgi:hypothetical protein
MIAFEQAGKENTQATLEAAFTHALTHQISPLVVATTWGETGVRAAEMGREKGVAVVVVTHNYGFEQPGVCQLEAEKRRRIEQAGGRIHTATLVLRGLGSALKKKFGYSESEIVAGVLRMFGQGMKVCVEMAAMAADAGLLASADAVFVAGTATGADTAVVIRPAPSNMFFDIKIRHIIAKPAQF